MIPKLTAIQSFFVKPKKHVDIIDKIWRALYGNETIWT